MTDADTGTTQARRAQLEAACEREGVPRRQEDDRALLIIPRRNIETWFAYLDGIDVDESNRYPAPEARTRLRQARGKPLRNVSRSTTTP